MVNVVNEKHGKQLDISLFSIVMLVRQAMRVKRQACSANKVINSGPQKNPWCHSPITTYPRCSVGFKQFL